MKTTYQLVKFANGLYGIQRTRVQLFGLVEEFDYLDLKWPDEFFWTLNDSYIRNCYGPWHYVRAIENKYLKRRSNDVVPDVIAEVGQLC